MPEQARLFGDITQLQTAINTVLLRHRETLAWEIRCLGCTSTSDIRCGLPTWRDEPVSKPLLRGMARQNDRQADMQAEGVDLKCGFEEGATSTGREVLTRTNYGWKLASEQAWNFFCQQDPQSTVRRRQSQYPPLRVPRTTQRRHKSRTGHSLALQFVDRAYHSAVIGNLIQGLCIQRKRPETDIPCRQ